MRTLTFTPAQHKLLIECVEEWAEINGNEQPDDMTEDEWLDKCEELNALLAHIKG